MKNIFKNIFRKKSLKEHFTDIYENNIWKGKESRSGEGSGFVQTHVIRNVLPDLMNELQVKVMVDSPCGDLCWIKDLDLNLEKYIGIDIVEAIIDSNKVKYNHTHRLFLCLDITKDPLPTSDLILSRDCLVHLESCKVLAAIDNFKKSGATYLLTTTFSEHKINLDLTGKQTWRRLNLELPPFNFPPPLRLINEHCTEENGIFSDKCLGLWRLSDL